MEEPRRPMWRLFRFIDQYRSAFWFSIGSSVTNKIFDLMPPFLTAWIIDSVSGQIPTWIPQLTGWEEPWPIVMFLAMLTIAIFGLESFFEWLHKRGFMRLAQRVQHDLRLQAYAALQKREMAYFESQRTGNLMAMLNDDVNQLERFLNSSFNSLIQLTTLVIVAGWSLISVSWQLGLLSMLPIPFIIWGSIYYQRKIAPYYREVREGVGALGNRLENNISGMLVIKSFTAEKYEQERIEQVSANYRDANFRAIRWSAVYFPLIRIPIALGFAGALLLGSYWVLFEPGTFSLGSLAFFAMMIQRLLWPVTILGTVFDEYQRAKASARRIFGLLDTPTQIFDPAEPVEVDRLKGNIELQDVHFSYFSDQPVLSGLSMQIEAGQTIGIAGATGGGKTTLIKLLLRLYDVKAGQMLIDGIKVPDMRLEDLRRNIALVSQDVYLFHGTIRENIAYGAPDTPLEVVREVARKAQLADFIEDLPQQYETIIGERGVKLSGGQRQRLSIARALLKDAPILILDEATSAVDTETERAIQDSLEELTAEKTALIIAHRLSTIRNADQILVLKEGQVAESGTHDALLQKQGLYANLWDGQIKLKQDSQS